MTPVGTKLNFEVRPAFHWVYLEYSYHAVRDLTVTLAAIPVQYLVHKGYISSALVPRGNPIAFCDSQPNPAPLYVNVEDDMGASLNFLEHRTG